MAQRCVELFCLLRIGKCGWLMLVSFLDAGVHFKNPQRGNRCTAPVILLPGWGGICHSPAQRARQCWPEQGVSQRCMHGRDIPAESMKVLLCTMQEYDLATAWCCRYAFAVYKTKEGATAALTQLNQAELQDFPGRKVMRR